MGVCVQFFLAQQLLPLAGFMNKTVFFNKAEDEDANLGERRLYNFSLKPTVRGGGVILFFFLDAMEKVGEKGCLKKCYCLNSGTSFGLKKNAKTCL